MGLTIGKAVGNSVVRHRTARRIRASFSGLLSSLPNGSQWVIRALPGAGECTTTTANIRTAVDRALVKAHGAS